MPFILRLSPGRSRSKQRETDMSEAANLWLYFLVVLGVIVLPGMDMAFVMGSSMTSGRRAGMAAVAGLVVSGFIHMLIAATGMSVLLKLLPGALTAIMLAGAAYIAWIGIDLLRVSSLTGPAAVQGGRSGTRSFFGAIATGLSNPKAYVFMLAIFPQFVHAERGSYVLQIVALSVITALTQFTIYGGLAMAAAQAQPALAARPKVNAILAKGVGVVLIVAAVMTVVTAMTAV
jgi:threonine/homoserine/homoserine lactone efflux protein